MDSGRRKRAQFFLLSCGEEMKERIAERDFTCLAKIMEVKDFSLVEC